MTWVIGEIRCSCEGSDFGTALWVGQQEIERAVRPHDMRTFVSRPMACSIRTMFFS